MRNILQQGSCRFEILDRHDSVMNFHDITSALGFLRHFKNDPGQMATLRACLAQSDYQAYRLDEDGILQRIASLLITGQIILVRKAERPDGVLAQVDPQEKTPDPVEAAKAKTPKARSWVEINLKDAKGTPIGGEHYRLKLPDGSVHEGNLDAFGHAEYYEINRGTCEISFPDLEDEEWSPA